MNYSDLLASNVQLHCQLFPGLGAIPAEQPCLRGCGRTHRGQQGLFSDVMPAFRWPK